MCSVPVTRRRFLAVLSAAVPVVALGACGAPRGARATTVALSPTSAAVQPPIVTSTSTAAAAASTSTARQASAAPSPAGGGVALRMSYLGSAPGYDAFRTHELAAFGQAHPGISAEFAPVSGPYADKITAEMAAGDPPDVFSNEPSPLPNYADKQQIIALDPLIARDHYDLADFFPQPLSQYHWNGKLYGLLWNGFRCHFYNVDAFAKAGVAPPPTTWSASQWTWQSFLDTAQRLTQKGAVTHFGYNVPRSGTRDWGAWVWSNGGDLLSADRRQCLLNQAPAVEALQFLQDLLYKNQVAPTPAEETTAQGAAKMFTSGQSAVGWFVTGSVWNAFKTVSFQWEVLPTPLAPHGQDAVVTGGGQGWFLPSQGKHHDEAWLLAQWLVSQAMMLQEVQQGFTVPARQSVAANPIWADRHPPAHVALLTEAMTHLHVDPLLPNIVDVRKVIDDGLSDVWQNKRSAQEATNQIVQVVNPMLRGQQ